MKQTSLNRVRYVVKQLNLLIYFHCAILYVLVRFAIVLRDDLHGTTLTHRRGLYKKYKRKEKMKISVCQPEIFLF